MSIMFKTGEEAAEFVMNRQGHHCGYPRFAEVMQVLGNPQDSFRTIHVAGTNGKGSTCSYLATVLTACGFKTGLYTSPFLVNHRDRIRVNNQWISEMDFRDYVNSIFPLIDQYNLSMFEIDTIVACLYFRDKSVDWAVMEAGVGGRKDATNTIHYPSLSVLTTVGLDHMSSLGGTIREIAAEKAGIIKEDGKILIGNLLPEAAEEVTRKAEEMHAAVYRCLPFSGINDRTFELENVHYQVSVSAEYQKSNAALALSAASLLGVDITSEPVRDAIRNHTWLGRFETVREKPCVILDGAHNPEGIEALTRSFQNVSKPVIVVFSALRDKQGPLMAEMLREKADRLYVTKFGSYRAGDVHTFSERREEIVPEWKEALRMAEQEAGAGGTVIVTGSLYFISDVREYYLNTP